MKLLETFTRLSRRLPDWTYTVVVMAAILWLTLAPEPVGDIDLPLFPGLDKVVHACMFGGLTGVAWFDCGRRGGAWHSPRLLVRIICAGASLAVGIAIEYAQRAMGMGRGFEWEDMAADAAGCLLAFVIVSLWGRKVN